MDIERAKKEDLPEILALQKLAYRSEAEIYGNFEIQPLTQTLAQLQQEFETKIILKAVDRKEILGSVRGFISDKTGFIEKLIVHPRCQKQGIGTALLAALEAKIQGTARFQLFTGHLSTGNIAFYQKKDYHEFKREKINEKLTFVWLEKNK
jgi:ribosomal protein S18 acetylase RimI-like enzyme